MISFIRMTDICTSYTMEKVGMYSVHGRTMQGYSVGFVQKLNALIIIMITVQWVCSGSQQKRHHQQKVLLIQHNSRFTACQKKN